MDHMMMLASERVCYVHCNFCNTILAVSVPCSSMYAAAVTVRCGHCSTLLSVNMAAAAAAAASNTFQFSPQQPDHLLLQLQKQHEQQAPAAGLLEGPPGDQQRGITRKSSDITVISLSSSSTSKSSTSSSSSSSPNSTSNNIKINPNVSAAFAALNHHRLQYSSEQYHHEPPRTPPIRPPEKRQRVPSAYNKFIKEEIQRIKASNPEISHREAFSLAAKNWAHFPRIHFGLNLESQTIPAVEGTQQKSPGFY